jgi:hypothetical protein
MLGQELFTPYSRFTFDALLSSDYHIIHAVHVLPKFPWVSYLLPVGLAILVGKWGLLVNPYTILWVSNMILKPVLFPGVPVVKHLGSKSSSFMATCTIFSKRIFKSARAVEVKGFEHGIRGYPVPSWRKPGKLFFLYIQHTFFRPHYNISEGITKEGGRVLAVNVHLILGNPNPYRAKQMEVVLERVRELAREGDEIYICGDFNIDSNDKSETTFQLLKAEGYQDSLTWAQGGGTRDGSRTDSITWSPSNKYVPNDEDDKDLNTRLDYVWYKGKGKGEEHEVIFNEKDNLVSDHYGVQAVVKIKSS